MKIIISKDYEEMSKLAAFEVNKSIGENPEITLGLATGKTPEGLYKNLITMYKNNEIDFSKVKSVNLDEYIGASKLINSKPHKDLSSHSIVKEIKALFGIDNKKALAIVAPSLWHSMKEEKREKLLQYATNVLDITYGTEEERIDLAISKTKEFFQSLGIKTHLSDYGIRAKDINDMLKYIDHHKMNFLGENKSITLDISRKILEESL